MIIESQLSVKWDTTKTKRYPEEIPVYLIKNKIEIVHTWRYRRVRAGFCQILVYFVFLIKVYRFFLTRSKGVKFLYF